MDEHGATAEQIVSRSREISQERWTAIQAELDDSKGAAYMALESCPTDTSVDGLSTDGH